MIILKPVTWFLTLKLFWFVAPDPGSGASSQDTNWNSNNVPLKKNILNSFNLKYKIKIVYFWIIWFGELNLFMFKVLISTFEYVCIDFVNKIRLLYQFE